jgi:hypothetical protein
MQQSKQPFWAPAFCVADAQCREACPATSQLEWLGSTTAMIVLFWSKATRDLL